MISSNNLVTVSNNQVFIIGNPRAGKTTLIDRITDGHKEPVADDEPTVLKQWSWTTALRPPKNTIPNIERSGLGLLVEDGGPSNVRVPKHSDRKLRININEISAYNSECCRETYKIVYTLGALTCLVFDMREYIAKGFSKTIGHWLDIITPVYSIDDIYLIGTHSDQMKPKQIADCIANVSEKIKVYKCPQQEPKMNDHFIEKMKGTSEGKSAIDRLNDELHEHVYIAGRYTDSIFLREVNGLKSLKSRITDFARKSKRVLPKKWEHLFKELNSLNQKLLPWTSVVDVYQHVFECKDKKDIEEIIQHLHQTGQILKLPGLLSNFIFVSRGLLTKIISSLFYPEREGSLEYLDKNTGFKMQRLSFLENSLTTTEWFHCFLNRFLLEEEDKNNFVTALKMFGLCMPFREKGAIDKNQLLFLFRLNSEDPCMEYPDQTTIQIPQQNSQITRLPVIGHSRVCEQIPNIFSPLSESYATTIQSSPLGASTEVALAEPREAVHDNIYAVLVAGSDPETENMRLFTRDAETVYTVITDTRIMGVRPENVRLLTPNAEVENNRSNTTNVINSLKEISKDQDNIWIIFYYSGHSDGTGFKLNEEILKATTIKHEFEKFRNAEEIFVILDCCFAAGTDCIEKGETSISPIPDLKITPAVISRSNQKSLGEGSLCGFRQWSSSRGSQTSLGNHTDSCSYFTEFIVRGLCSAQGTCFMDECQHCKVFRSKSQADGFISLGDLQNFVYEHVVNLCKVRKMKGKHQPTMSGEHSRVNRIGNYHTGRLFYLFDVNKYHLRLKQLPDSLPELEKLIRQEVLRNYGIESPADRQVKFFTSPEGELLLSIAALKQFFATEVTSVTLVELS